MQIIKYCMLFCVFGLSILIGNYIARKYAYRVKELEEIKNTLNIFKSKIKFTYEPIPEIFEDIGKSNNNISKLFLDAREKMKNKTASEAWEESVNSMTGNLKEEDKHALLTLSKLLGETDTEGQISQIEITEGFINRQLKLAESEKEKNEKMYKKLGIICGIGLVIILI